MFYKIKSGFSLIEILVTLTIISIIANFTIPYFQEKLAKIEQSKLIAQIQSSLVLAKHHAQLNHTDVVICSSRNLKECQNKQWHVGYMIFIDLNKNKQIDSNEMLLSKELTALKYGTLDWRGALSSPTITFLSQYHGLPIGSNGSFYYCSIYNKEHKRVLLSKMGWTRVETTTSC